MPLTEELQTQHESLLAKQASNEDILDEVHAYIRQVRQDSSRVTSPQARDQLRANLRYWAGYVYERTGEYPNLELAPATAEGMDEALERIDEDTAEVRRPRISSVVLMVIVVAIILVVGVILISWWNQPDAAGENTAVVEAAIRQTSTAQAELEVAEIEAANEIGTAVAAQFATQIWPSSTELSSSDLTESAIEREAELTVIAEEHEATLDAIIENTTATQRALDFEQGDAISAELTLIAEEEIEEPMGGGEEEAACAGRLFGTCATNISDFNVVVRTGPGTQWPSVTVLFPDDTVPVICTLQDGWLNITWSFILDRDGWVAEEFMLVEGQELEICLEIPPTPFPTSN